jgi:hypothetical protein
VTAFQNQEDCFAESLRDPPLLLAVFTKNHRSNDAARGLVDLLRFDDIAHSEDIVLQPLGNPLFV